MEPHLLIASQYFIYSHEKSRERVEGKAVSDIVKLVPKGADLIYSMSLGFGRGEIVRRRFDIEDVHLGMEGRKGRGAIYRRPIQFSILRSFEFRVASIREASSKGRRYYAMFSAQ